MIAQNFDAKNIEGCLYSENKKENMKYAPITFVDVERSFSRYANILNNRRKSFIFGNLRMVSIVAANIPTLKKFNIDNSWIVINYFTYYLNRIITFMSLGFLFPDIQNINN